MKDAELKMRKAGLDYESIDAALGRPTLVQWVPRDMGDYAPASAQGAQMGVFSFSKHMSAVPLVNERALSAEQLEELKKRTDEATQRLSQRLEQAALSGWKNGGK